MRELGIEVKEELKLVTDEEWSTYLDSLSIPKIKIRKLKVDLDWLSDTGPIEAFIIKPFHVSCHSHEDNVGSKPESKLVCLPNRDNKRKSGNFGMRDFPQQK